MTISESIKMLAKQYINTMDFSNVELGSVVSVSPLTIKVKGLTLPQECFIVPRSMTDFEICHRRVRYENSDYNIENVNELRQWSIVYEGIKLGETLILIKLHGGQRYLVVDRV